MNIDLRNMILEWVIGLIMLQFSFVMLLAIGVTFLLFYRHWRVRKVEELTKIEGDNAVMEMIGMLDSAQACHLRRYPSWRVLRNRAVRDALLQQIHSVSGRERNFLAKRYLQLGFAVDDIALTRSRFWFKRLEGVTRLSQLQHRRLARVFKRLLTDDNRLIAATALLALSGLKHELNVPDIDRLDRLLEDGRLTLIRAILANWCQIHGFQSVFSEAAKYQSGYLRNRTFSALLTAKTPESGVLLVKTLTEETQMPAELIGEFLIALREINEPRAMDVARKLFRHPDPRIKERAAELILAVGDELMATDLLLLSQDESAGVRRALRDWHHNKVAA